MFFWLGLRPDFSSNRRQTRRVSAVLVGLFVGIFIAVMIPEDGPSSLETSVDRELRRAFQESELMRYEIRREAPIYIIATVRQSVSSPVLVDEITSAKEFLTESLNSSVDLDVVVQPFVRASDLGQEQALREKVEQIIEQELTQGELVETHLDEEASRILAIIVTEVSAEDPEHDSTLLLAEIAAARATLSEQLELPLELDFALQNRVVETSDD